MARPDSSAPDGEAVLVREGFAWGAFVFGPLWALWHGQWLAALALLAAEAGLATGAIALAPVPEAVASVGLAWRVALGFAGAAVLRLAMTAGGWRERAIVAAPTRADAERRWLSTPPGAAR